MDLLDILRQDYQNFPQDQTFAIYSDDVFFQDPLNRFRGRDRYQKMIGFLGRWFRDIHLELHDLQQTQQTIRSEWTLSMTCPLPWQPRLRISGYSLLEVNADNLIVSHIDYWQKPPLKVLLQVFQSPTSP
ncbi:DUF2358 domain-containing protein [Picosynechococcus sp. PCC 7117]|uniref:DUF2358 domain-containing protein n=1 Tax=Picosynechococcus sp. PCC 7117 TaxID=195498 RepID=UPI0008104AA8|nr:DUF2358 domain-containing protein [Picosynechococcus sp. PCC 7117]ANV86577.1 hypothetical protein AWQ22_03310 [Picosynechococcus sp. PCC 7117]